MTHWTNVSDSTSLTFGFETSSSQTWTDDSGADTTARNASRFIQSYPTQDTNGGIDFALVFTQWNPFIFTNIDPRSFRSTALADPTTG